MSEEAGKAGTKRYRHRLQVNQQNPILARLPEGGQVSKGLVPEPKVPLRARDLIPARSSLSFLKKRLTGAWAALTGDLGCLAPPSPARMAWKKALDERD